MMKKIKKIRGNLILLLLAVVAFLACSRDDYYTDGGRAEAIFDGSIMEYLDAKPREFDTIAQIVRLAGLEDRFRSDEFTFFAPHDADIKELIGSYTEGGLNRSLYELMLDTIVTLADVDPEIWAFYLQRHMFRGKNLLADYPQIDLNLRSVYGGQNYYSLGDAVCNIGVEFQDAVSSDGSSRLQYMGYRQLGIGYIRDLSKPTEYGRINVSSSDIQPRNGVVHVLDYRDGEFGFSNNQVIVDIIESKR
ncbi:fasciclin domain-containing protein [Sphingobacterium gobiense]|uniref:FAS1 domain-containing protein n=1 Tax=Sphingobacterium gobiense TaxID=1382456 RepID=A0A2S9JSB4_9SPHI|nr:fasciclin domain-containing protein [Sphingobacterium gobiense]PRD56169.1 hypothetical protein C5749_02530 [Sphingobacterium gobiense]